VRLPHRGRIAASVLPLMFAVLALPGAQGATGNSIKTTTDPTGDTVEEQSSIKMTEPHGDAVETIGEYGVDGLSLKLKVADPVKPKADNDWQYPGTGVGWQIDTNGDFKPEFAIEYGLDKGKIYADVFKNGAQDPVCQGTADFADQYYRVVLDRNCIDSPDSIYFKATVIYAHSANVNDDQSVDNVPDVSFAGPIVFPTDPGPAPGPGPGGTNPGPGGGTDPGSTTPPPPPGQGYWLVAKDGGVFTYGQSAFKGSTGNIKLNQPIASMTARPDGAGYWFVAADGGIFAFGDIGFFGSTGNLKLNRPIVGMAATPTGRGYWLVANDGGIFAFGDAGYFGSTGATKLNRPIVGMAATPTGRGYWLVADDGGVFAFGDAGFFGSTGNLRLNRPIVGMASNATGKGYWFVADDGGVFTFGDAKFFGAGANIAGMPVVGISATRAGDGYRLVRSDGSVNFYGAAQNKGSMAGKGLAQPIVGMASQ
jgi:hypothetical protein